MKSLENQVPHKRETGSTKTQIVLLTKDKDPLNQSWKMSKQQQMNMNDEIQTKF